MEFTVCRRVGNLPPVNEDVQGCKLVHRIKSLAQIPPQRSPITLNFRHLFLCSGVGCPDLIQM